MIEQAIEDISLARAAQAMRVLAALIKIGADDADIAKASRLLERRMVPLEHAEHVENMREAAFVGIRRGPRVTPLT